jgi:hypothetical protein
MPQTVRIELSDEQMAALNAQAAAQGLTLGEWFKVLAAREAAAANCREIAQAAAARILGAADPEAATIRESIDRGRA